MERSNKYIFIYSTILVVVVAAVLSITAYTLKPIQKKNVEIEKKQDILKSIGVKATTTTADELYDKYIKEAKLVDYSGKIIEGSAFNANMKTVYSVARKDRNLPLFKAQKNDSTFIVVPLTGKGLWGPIWGYLSFVENKSEAIAYNQIYGAIFDHKSETPGLGAEINKPEFQKMFKNKSIFDKQGEFVSIKVIKGGAPDGSINGVDAISGGTITSVAVQAMIDTCVSSYSGYFNKN